MEVKLNSKRKITSNRLNPNDNEKSFIVIQTLNLVETIGHEPNLKLAYGPRTFWLDFEKPSACDGLLMRKKMRESPHRIYSVQI